MNRILNLCLILVLTLVQQDVSAADGKSQVWTDPKSEDLPKDFKFQGEYAATGIGVQIIALGHGTFQGVVYPGGLPGSGWNGVDRSLMSGKLQARRAVFEPATGQRSYLAADPAQFSASKAYPPHGNQAFTASINRGARQLTLVAGNGLTLKLFKTVRRSPTLGMKPMDGATVLFDGTHANMFDRGRVDQKTTFLNTDGKDIRTKQSFQNYTMHLEFMLPYRPDARGQGRGNSGFYQVDHYELQILDSFGLEGVNNECGGIYTKAKPSVNMCFPPLHWQTYDVQFKNAIREGDKKVKNATLTVWHNGVKIHDQLEITGKTGGSRSAPEGTPGPIKLQGHGNPLQFRNIWIQEND